MPSKMCQKNAKARGRGALYLRTLRGPKEEHWGRRRGLGYRGGRVNYLEEGIQVGG